MLQVEKEEGRRAHAYVVHFQGWKKSWDEPVLSHNVFEHNDDNLRIAHRLLDGAKMRQQQIQPSEHDEHEDQDENMVNEVEEKEGDDENATEPSAQSLFHFPIALQKQLVDDYEYVTRDRKLVPLPREITVKQILDKWIACRKHSNDKAAKEVAEGLQIYFDCCLSKILLYHFERPQFEEVFKKQENEAPSAIYGAEHLLRLLVKLPFVLEEAPLEKDKLQALADKTNDLTKYLHKNGRAMFLSEYEAASEEYINNFHSTDA